jgi:hypothetical protein
MSLSTVTRPKGQAILDTVRATRRPVEESLTGSLVDETLAPAVFVRSSTGEALLPVADLVEGARLVEALKATAHEVTLYGTRRFRLTGSRVAEGGYLHGRRMGDWL